MTTVNMHDAKTHLSALVRRVQAGEEIVIAKAGKPIAKLVAVPEPQVQRVLGHAKGKIWMSPDFDAPLSEDELAEFEKPL